MVVITANGPWPKAKVKSAPREHFFRKYAATREYIHDRCIYDAEFKKYKKSHYLTDFCQQLTFIFDWPVEYNSLYKSLKRRLKHPKKDHLPK